MSAKSIANVESLGVQIEMKIPEMGTTCSQPREQPVIKFRLRKGKLHATVFATRYPHETNDQFDERIQLFLKGLR